MTVNAELLLFPSLCFCRAQTLREDYRLLSGGITAIKWPKHALPTERGFLSRTAPPCLSVSDERRRPGEGPDQISEVHGGAASHLL